MSGKPAHESDTSPVADDAAQDETLDEPQDETAQAEEVRALIARTSELLKRYDTGSADEQD